MTKLRSSDLVAPSVIAESFSLPYNFSLKVEDIDDEAIHAVDARGCDVHLEHDDVIPEAMYRLQEEFLACVLA